MIDRLTSTPTAYDSVNSVHDLIEHPQLRTRRMAVRGHVVALPALPWGTGWAGDPYPEAPALDAHGAALRAKFA